MFSWPDISDIHLERTANILADVVCPVLLETIIKGMVFVIRVSLFCYVPVPLFCYVQVCEPVTFNDFTLPKAHLWETPF